MWTTQFLQNASHNNNHHNMLVYLCAAPTGTGKTVLIPIFLLNAHWQRVAVKLTLTIAALQEERTEEGSHYCITSLEAFVQDFKKDSTVQIIVCQPTRFACREVAGYVGALLSSATRVGYAVSGDRTSTKETEIIFTTPAYLTELLFRPQRTIGLFAPTTIVLDEAHERKVPSDILFSFLKLMRETPHVRATYPLYRALQQIVVMSATMSMANAFQYFSNKENHHNPILLLNEAQRHLVREYKMKKGVLDDSINVDQLEYIQVVERQTLTDGLQKNNQSSENNYPIERYFIEDIQNFQFLQSKLLFDNDNNVGLRTEDGKHALQQLADCFLSTTNNNNNMHQNKNSIESKLKHFNFGNFSNGTSITQFVLFLVEALTVRFISNHPHPHNTPVGMILFLPGLSEIMSLRAQLEAKCAVDYYYPISETETNNNNNPHFMEPLLTLRYANHNMYFSVPILHGNLNTNLNDMIDMATNQHDQHHEVPPVFVILATNVAESSVTIPNLKIVLNFCLERSFVDVASQNKNKNHNSHLFSDSMMKIKTNHIISFSSLKQREGRVGRTGEGVAIHFITKDYYLNQNELITRIIIINIFPAVE
ncbi:hypothetical protein AGDE_16142 [Angomonas deanei]|uniref:DEAD/DEAH box helicase/Helicase conserved C-terminal domain containing protein, putative n=1 Tax=Angomonas deanei TaxID=59799 RepID=A0A7G2CNG3_9TRYP|nr:hypothetical protein AGDE_16142 [Angomonas deanei]CAD2220627.1 DEAD/DEAH box helicase/Helicase conserved C-terminal domain containing protein, putative [Angomonas deanei]|eukprot:EPY17636.1 hypothetical protein AGDE_16142 [Angomonas deanei]